MEDIFFFTILFQSVLSISLNLRSVVLFVESKGFERDSTGIRKKISADIASFHG